MYTLKCGDGKVGCGSTTTVARLMDSKDGFLFEPFNGRFYICPKKCTNANVDIFDNAVRKTFTVSKEEMQRRESEWQKTHGNEVQRKKPV